MNLFTWFVSTCYTSINCHTNQESFKILWHLKIETGKYVSLPVALKQVYVCVSFFLPKSLHIYFIYFLSICCRQPAETDIRKASNNPKENLELYTNQSKYLIIIVNEKKNYLFNLGCLIDIPVYNLKTQTHVYHQSEEKVLGLCFVNE